MRLRLRSIALTGIILVLAMGLTACPPKGPTSRAVLAPQSPSSPAFLGDGFHSVLTGYMRGDGVTAVFQRTQCLITSQTLRIYAHGQLDIQAFAPTPSNPFRRILVERLDIPSAGWVEVTTPLPVSEFEIWGWRDFNPSNPNESRNRVGWISEIERTATVDCTPPDDLDQDGVVNRLDNCPLTPNHDQRDSDDDSLGDACDGFPYDYDNDGHDDDADNCPEVANPGQEDSDGNGVGDACDEFTGDADEDGVLDAHDNCPADPNPNQTDSDGDGAGNICDPIWNDFDDDADFVPNDNCPTIANPNQTDTDGDGMGDACDDVNNDPDFDGILSPGDNCPVTANPAQEDTDGDQLGNVCDPTPYGPDTDGDGHPNFLDNCRYVFNPLQENSDHIPTGDACVVPVSSPGACEHYVGPISISDEQGRPLHIDRYGRPVIGTAPTGAESWVRFVEDEELGCPRVTMNSQNSAQPTELYIERVDNVWFRIRSAVHGLYLTVDGNDVSWSWTGHGDASGTRFNADAWNPIHPIWAAPDDSPMLNPLFYLWSYSDLRQSMGFNYEAARNHWIANGRREGRRSSPVLDVAYYQSRNPDLTAAFGNDYVAMVHHWQVWGGIQHRRASRIFDPVWYLANHPDLRHAFGPQGYVQAAMHFNDLGLGSCRQGSADFDPWYYRAANPDVAAVFQNSCVGVAAHWLSHGRAEGRPGIP